VGGEEVELVEGVWLVGLLAGGLGSAGMSAYVSIRQHTSAYVSIRQHMWLVGLLAGGLGSAGMLLHVC
jgi:hypothetical protein